MPLYGSSVRDPNLKLRFCLVAFSGVMIFGVLLAWRSSLLFAAQYQDFPKTHYQAQIEKENELKKKLIEVEE